MGIQLEVRERIMCVDMLCVTEAIVKSVLEKIGIDVDQNVEDVVLHAKKLAELINEGYFDAYTFVFRGLEITIYDIDYSVDECGLEGCEGYFTVEFEVAGDIASVRQVIKKLLRDIGADKYVKICE